MLIKSICQHCWEKHPLEDEGDCQVWNDLDEEFWGHDIVHCPVVCVNPSGYGNRRMAVVSEDVPDWCPFHLEHVLRGGS